MVEIDRHQLAHCRRLCVPFPCATVPGKPGKFYDLHLPHVFPQPAPFLPIDLQLTRIPRFTSNRVPSQYLLRRESLPRSNPCTWQAIPGHRACGFSGVCPTFHLVRPSANLLSTHRTSYASNYPPRASNIPTILLNTLPSPPHS